MDYTETIYVCSFEWSEKRGARLMKTDIKTIVDTVISSMRSICYGDIINRVIMIPDSVFNSCLHLDTNELHSIAACASEYEITHGKLAIVQMHLE